MAVLIIILLIAAGVTFYFWKKGKLRNILSGGGGGQLTQKQVEELEAKATKLEADAKLAEKARAAKDRILIAKRKINNSLRPPQE